MQLYLRYMRPNKDGTYSDVDLGPKSLEEWLLPNGLGDNFLSRVLKELERNNCTDVELSQVD